MSGPVHDPTGGDGYIRDPQWRKVEKALLGGEITDEQYERLARLKPGDRVRMTGVMANEPDPIPVGTEGTVTEVHPDVRQIYVDWDRNEDGRKRSLILLTEDPYEVIP